MKLGTGLYQQPGEHVEIAQVMFLELANDVDSRPLAEVYSELFGPFRRGDNVDAAIGGWCRRWHFVFNGEPAEWAVNRVRWTMGWWRRERPEPQQYITAKNGNRPVDPTLGPLEWWTGVFTLPVPSVFHEGETSPFIHHEEYNIYPLPSETGLQFHKRLSREYRARESRLANAAKQAQAMLMKLLVRTPSKPNFMEHAAWAVSFQIGGFDIDDILKAVSAEWSTVDKGIRSILRMIMLTRREPTAVGRPRKSGKPRV